MRFQSYLNSAVTILRTYNGSQPFHLYVKKYFSANKKYGSKDRKQITSLCYNYFRLCNAVKNISIEERIVLATFLCENKSLEFLQAIKPEWNDVIELSITDKLAISNGQLAIENIFPFKDELSEGIDAEKFNASFLIQPDLFLRVRPGNDKRVEGKLAGAGVHYKLINENSIALPNSSKINEVIELDKEAVVQDYNSQRIAEFIQLQTKKDERQPTVWDCCAASGGKSIMAYDINPSIELTVSDKRESILENLKKRFATAGIKKYHSFRADLSTGDWQKETKKFDLIICDAPCTGSGTWARTPEQLYYFKKDAIEKYAALQKKILENVVPHVKPGADLLYITCSVFKKENEDVVAYIKQKFRLKVKEMKILGGYESNSDNMFAALFTAPRS
ncbi:MAG: Fmu (Sun) domain-containing protein [Ginsengibacter sp.]